MKFRLLGKNLDDIRPALTGRGWLEAGEDELPELVVAHGGDGTLLYSEWLFPGIPKLALRDCRTAPLCSRHDHKGTVEEFAAGSLVPARLPMIDGIAGDRTLSGVNDVFLHNIERGSALRYRVWIDDELYADVVVGDGVGLATVHGSTAYYRSITHSVFRVGHGLAFSNSTEVVNHLVIAETSVVRVRILRGPGMLIADNAPDSVRIEAGGEVIFRRSQRQAVIYGLEVFMCPECRALRHPRPHGGGC